MRRNLAIKTVVIVAILLVFAYGIFFGSDFDKGREAWKKGGWKAALQSNIHLGLDLRGGTHLILQVQVNDAINADSDRAIERLKDQFSKAQPAIAYGDISKPD